MRTADKFRTGDDVVMTYEGRTVQAVVALASSNGRSLMLTWNDGMLGGHVGMMPVFREESGRYVSLMEWQEVILTYRH